MPHVRRLADEVVARAAAELATGNADATAARGWRVCNVAEESVRATEPSRLVALEENAARARGRILLGSEQWAAIVIGVEVLVGAEKAVATE
jgi:hypothetical protein